VFVYASGCITQNFTAEWKEQVGSGGHLTHNNCSAQVKIYETVIHIETCHLNHTDYVMMVSIS
jgi:hypothetical protein